MILSNTLDKVITETLAKNREDERANRKSSGKLSASMLGWPLQWMVLKTIGVKEAPFDEYTLRKFLRGHHVEEWVLQHLPGVKDKQKFVEYREAIGYCDAIIDLKDYDCALSVVSPAEIKSVSSAKYRRVVTSKEPDYQHMLQACFYALAEDADYFSVIYVCTDDYRVNHWVFETKDYSDDVDEIITRYTQAMRDFHEKGFIPEFEAVLDYQESEKYQRYPEWTHLTEIELLVKGKEILGR